MKRVYGFTRNLIAHPLFSGSAVMIVGTNIGNFIAYLYHLVIGRLLGPASYSELAAVLSILGLIFASLTFLGLVVVKFVSSAKPSELPGIYSWFNRKSTLAGAGLAFFALVLTPFLSNFLHIKTATFLLTVPILLISVSSFVYRSFLQGLLKFKAVVVALNLDMLLRLALGVLFITLGLSSFGTVLGLVFSTIISFFLLKYFLREYHTDAKAKPFNKSREILKYATPIFFATFATNSMFSTDVVLVKHFFDSHDAGIYASVSTLGKIIFFGAGPVGAVMFPMISKRHALGKGYKKIFSLSLLLTLAIALGVLTIYWVFPELSITILYGNEFIEGVPYLVPMGFFMTLFTVSSLVLNYFLSKNNTRVTAAVVVVSIMQIVGIWLFHNTLLSVIKVSIFSSSVFLVSLLLYFAHEGKTRASI